MSAENPPHTIRFNVHERLNVRKKAMMKKTIETMDKETKIGDTLLYFLYFN